MASSSSSLPPGPYLLRTRKGSLTAGDAAELAQLLGQVGRDVVEVSTVDRSWSCGPEEARRLTTRPTVSPTMELGGLATPTCEISADLAADARRAGEAGPMAGAAPPPLAPIALAAAHPRPFRHPSPDQPRPLGPAILVAGLAGMALGMGLMLVAGWRLGAAPPAPIAVEPQPSAVPAAQTTPSARPMVAPARPSPPAPPTPPSQPEPPPTANQSTPGVTRPEPVKPMAIWASSGRPYAWAQAKDGVKLYTDRAYTLAKLPESLRGAQILRTANDDDGVASPEHLRFTLPQRSRVLIAFSDSAQSLPGWMQGYTPVDGTVMVAGKAGGFRLYACELPAGPVTLGGNDRPATLAVSNYIVFVLPLP